jgi:hypothetical protein
MATITECYQCGECDHVYEDEDDAADCCKPRVIEGWKCDACGDFHRLELNAKTCCTSGFICVVCGVDWQSEEEATECCSIEYIAPPATPAELEQAGQQRISFF